MKIIVTLLLVFSISAGVFAQVDLNGKLPVSPMVRTGKLPNGITYYVRENRKPENRAELRLVVNAGSVEETDNQQGLAHLCEHMCFNGTKNFKKTELVDFLERSGIRFGADLNAYTSFDETVYMLQIPTDTEALFEKGLLVLQDWAHDVSFESDEIDKERGVVIEEWRLGQGADERMLRQYFPVYMKDSKYAQRLPIGKKEIIENAPYDTLRAFYKKWYRPEFQAIVAVGDFDGAKVEKMIKEKFGKISAPALKINHPVFPVPDQNQLLVSVATDKEASNTGIQLEYKLPVEEEKTVNDYRNSILENMFTGMLNQRYSELQQTANPPFAYAQSSYGSVVRTKAGYSNFAIVSDTGIAKGLQTIVVENERVKKFGFTQTELERFVKQILRNVERQYNERDKTESRNLVGELVNNFLEQEPIPGIEWEYDMYKKLLPTIKLEDVNALAQKWITDNGENCVIVVKAPLKSGVTIPSEENIKKIYFDSKKLEVTPYQDKTVDKPLMSIAPTAGKIVSETKPNEFGIVEWKLSNGARVILKPTTFKNDEILFSGYAFGGSSLYSDKDFVSADNAAQIIDNSGIGDFDKTTLNKYLSDKIVRLSTNISDIQQTLSGSCSPKDLETLMQMIFLKFNQPRKDQTAFDSYMTQMRTSIENSNNDPNAVFRDSIQVIMSQHNFRYRPDDLNVLNECNFDRAYLIYRERFLDAGSYTYFFVGNFSVDQIKPMVQTYIGGLLGTGKQDEIVDLGITPPKGQFTKEVKKGTEPQSAVRLVYTGDFDYNRYNRNEINALVRLTNIKLRETLREDMSGVYGVSASPQLIHFPQPRYSLSIGFGCAPDNVEKLAEAAENVIATIKLNGCNEQDLLKVKELMLKERETALKQNNFWMNALSQSYQNDENILELKDFEKQIQNLKSDDFKRLASKYFDSSNLAKFVLNPEK